MSRAAVCGLVGLSVGVALATQLTDTAEQGAQECDSTWCQGGASKVSLLQVGLERQDGCSVVSGTYTERGTNSFVRITQNGCGVTVQYEDDRDIRPLSGTVAGRRMTVVGSNAPGDVSDVNGDIEFTDNGYWGKHNCPATTHEYAIDLCMSSFSSRHDAIKNFRAYLEELEDSIDWFKHKKGNRTRQVKADYFLVNGNSDLLESRFLEFRYRKDVAGDVVGRTDFAIKFKQPQRGFPFRPLTAGANSPDGDKWSCKREDNLKYLAPGKDIVLEAQEQQGRYKSKKASEPIFNSADEIDNMGDVIARFPSVAKFFWLPADATLVARQPSQWRYIVDNVELELDANDDNNNGKDAQTDSSFTLWYDSQQDMEAGTNPIIGEWSFKIEDGEDSWNYAERAEQILKLVGDKFRCPPAV